MKKYLITGAAGFIGSHLVDYLIEDGVKPENLRLFVAPWDTLENLKGRTYEIVVGDIRDKRTVEKAMQGIDIVYHLAAKTGSDGGEFEDFESTNVRGTKNLINFATKYKIKKFVFFSSIGVYGLPATTGDMCNISEESPKNYSEGYGKTKFLAEMALIEANHKHDLDYIIIRPSTVFGPRDKAGMAQLLNILKKGYFFYIGRGNNIMDYVYIKRLVGATRKLEKGNIKNEDFIIGSENPLSQKEMVSIICDELNIKRPYIAIPRLLALILSFLLKYMFLLVGKKPIIFPNRIKVLSADCYFDSSKVSAYVKDLQGKYTFREGIRSIKNTPVDTVFDSNTNG